MVLVAYRVNIKWSTLWLFPRHFRSFYALWTVFLNTMQDGCLSSSTPAISSPQHGRLLSLVLLILQGSIQMPHLTADSVSSPPISRGHIFLRVSPWLPTASCWDFLRALSGHGVRSAYVQCWLQSRSQDSAALTNNQQDCFLGCITPRCGLPTDPSTPPPDSPAIIDLDNTPLTAFLSLSLFPFPYWWFLG